MMAVKGIGVNEILHGHRYSASPDKNICCHW
jgi:hypothetical protein